MTSEVWVSSVMTDSSIGNKQGAREKYFGEDWAPADFMIGPSLIYSSQAVEKGVD